MTLLIAKRLDPGPNRRIKPGPRSSCGGNHLRLSGGTKLRSIAARTLSERGTNWVRFANARLLV